MKRFIGWLKKQIDQPWFPGLLGISGFLDVYLVVIPTDGLVIASTLAHPKKWKAYAGALTLGSSLGGISLALLFSVYGSTVIESQFPGFMGSEFWLTTEQWVQRLGLWALFLFSLSPFSQQPAIILTAMTHHSLGSILWVVLLGRGLKYFGLCYLVKWAPDKITHLWGVRRELEELNKKGNP